MKKMSLLEKYRSGLLKEGDYIPNFKPDQGIITITEKDTGWKGNQIISTEKSLYQFAGIVGNKAILLSYKVTKHKIFLRGKIGYKKGPKTLKKVLEECYSSKQFEAKGFILTEEIFDKILESLKKKVKREEYYWLGTRCNKKYASKYEEWGLFYADYSKYKKCLIANIGGEYVSKNSIRPAIFIPVTTILDEKNNIVLKEQK